MGTGRNLVTQRAVNHVILGLMFLRPSVFCDTVLLFLVILFTTTIL